MHRLFAKVKNKSADPLICLQHINLMMNDHENYFIKPDINWCLILTPSNQYLLPTDCFFQQQQQQKMIHHCSFINEWNKIDIISYCSIHIDSVSLLLLFCTFSSCLSAFNNNNNNNNNNKNNEMHSKEASINLWNFSTTNKKYCCSCTLLNVMAIINMLQQRIDLLNIYSYFSWIF